MLYLVAMGQAAARHEVAHLLGVRRTTVGRWLTTYETGGVAALLDLYVPTGKPPSLAPEVRMGSAQGLRTPTGFGLRSTPPVGRTDRSDARQVHNARHHRPYQVYGQVHGAAPKPHTHAEAVAAFQATCRAQLRAAIPAATRRPVTVFAQDERRVGVLTGRRRRLRARGVQPVGRVHYVFENVCVYGAVAPSSGAQFFMECPHRNSGSFQVLLDAVARAYADTFNLLVLDNSRCHTAKRVIVPNNVAVVCLPP